MIVALQSDEVGLFIFSLSVTLRNKLVCVYMYTDVHIHSINHLVHVNAFPSLDNIKERIHFVLLVGSVR
jgi:hypothetical protein